MQIATPPVASPKPVFARTRHWIDLSFADFLEADMQMSPFDLAVMPVQEARDYVAAREFWDRMAREYAFMFDSLASGSLAVAEKGN